jgi:hypothetical protein
MTLSVEQLLEHVTTDLGEDALSRLLDAAYEAIEKAAGPGSDFEYDPNITELITPGPGDLIRLSKPATAVVAVTEGIFELEADDYELRPSGQLLRRLNTGTNPRSRWCGRVDVTYTPIADVNDRDRVAIALVKLDIDHQPGVQSETLGDHSITFSGGSSSSGSAYADQRAAILASLSPNTLLGA